MQLSGRSLIKRLNTLMKDEKKGPAILAQLMTYAIFKQYLIILKPVSRGFRKQTVRGCQIPLELSWCRSAYAAQGLTVVGMWVFLGAKELKAGATLVMLSRCKYWKRLTIADVTVLFAQQFIK